MKNHIISQSARSAGVASWLGLLCGAALIFGGEDAVGQNVTEPDQKVKAAATSAIKQVVELGEHFTDKDVFALKAFAEPLVPLSTADAPEIVEAFRKAVNDHLAGKVVSTVGEKTPIEVFIAQYPNSRWRPALEMNLGMNRYQQAYFSRALTHWENAYTLAKNEKNPRAKAMADAALAELVMMHSRIGRVDKMGPLLKEAEAREAKGAARQMLDTSRQALWQMENEPADCFKCGPYALGNVMDKTQGEARRKAGQAYSRPQEIHDIKSTPRGFTFQEVSALATKVGQPHMLVKSVGERAEMEIPVPSVVHWKLDHYGAIVERRGDMYRLKDFTFDFEQWVPKEAILEEASGAFLITQETLPKDFVLLPPGEARKIFGRGFTGAQETNQTNDCEQQQGGNAECCPMATFSVHSMMVSLLVKDTPVGYRPPYGPRVALTVAYRERETLQPGTLNFSNFGRQWGFNFQSTLEVTHWSATDSGNHEPPFPHLDAFMDYSIALRTGGEEAHAFQYDYELPAEYEEYVADGMRTFARGPIALIIYGEPEYVPHDPGSGAIVNGAHDGEIARVRPDGSKEIYADPVTVWSWPSQTSFQDITTSRERYRLSKVVDPAGNAVVISYDSLGRVEKLTDPNGLETTFFYELEEDEYKVTKVVDPYDRQAVFTYNEDGDLETITDILGIESSFTYASGSILDSITTPYGTTTIERESAGIGRSLTATDPMGYTEKIAFGHFFDGIPADVPADQKPASSVTVGGESVSFPLSDGLFSFRNTLFWSKKAMAMLEGVTDPVTRNRGAEISHWLHTEDGRISAVLEFTKRPFDNPIFYRYPDQTTPIATGKQDSPSKIARKVEGGATQLWQTSSNDWLLPTRSVDPLGREVVLEYDDYGIDLKKVKRKTASGFDTLLEAEWNSQHRPTTITDAAGNDTTLTYNARGQITSVTDAKSQVTAYTYDSDGFLTEVDGPLSGTSDKATFTYDDFGRVETRTYDGVTVAYEYDAADRVTEVTHGDATTEEFEYDKLDLSRSKDRLGHWTEYDYNANRQLVKVTDPLSRETSYEWCRCGKLQQLTDGRGNITKWQYDLQGRLLAKEYANGKKTLYEYTSARSLLAKITDARGQKKLFSYALDDALTGATYEDEILATADVGMEWDGYYPRLTEFTDGIGTTAYSYHAVGTDGAGAVSAIDGPLTDDTITYSYDEVGQLVQRQINGSANDQDYSYDALGRVTQSVNALGTFTTAYDGPSGRPASLARTGGMQTVISYLNAANDHRLESISHRPDGSTEWLGFDYTSNAVGNITEWVRKLASAPDDTFAFAYDDASQLTESVLTRYGVGTPLADRDFTYDLGGNVAEAGGDAPFYNSVNELKGFGDSVPTTISGTTNKASMVTVNGESATTGYESAYEVELDLPVGPISLTINAVTAASESKTSVWKYEVLPEDAFLYDENGNLTDDGTRTYEWDAEDRLVGIQETSSGNRSEFTYDGFSRRVKIVEKTGITTDSDRRYVWDELSIAESRMPDGETVEKSYFGQGFKAGSDAYYYTRDHLGSIRGLVDASGVERGRWDFGPWGERSANLVTSSPVEVDFGYTGHWNHARSGLALAPYRAYSAEYKRWISRDPIGEEGGINLYGYVANSPVNFVDKLGFDRDLYSFGHTWVEVDTWDDQGNKTGRAVLDFAPDSKFFPGASDWRIDPYNPYPGIPLLHVPSDCEADKKLLENWDERKETWNPARNCVWGACSRLFEGMGPTRMHELPPLGP